MNDRFKFRFFDKKKQKMMYEDSDFNDYCKEEWWGYEEQMAIASFYVFDDAEHYILMQCTGLKDKNGKLIYEGDIVRFKNNITINGSKTHIAVIEHNEVFNAFMYHAECIGFYTVNKAQNEKFDVEVIGNKYENADLLQKECER